jgi:glycosyltransferase involved in cell wall biosynthesis
VRHRSQEHPGGRHSTRLSEVPALGGPSDSVASLKQALRVPVRIFTDLPIGQLSWWQKRLTVFRWPNRQGALASYVAAWRAVRQARHHDVFVSANVRNALAAGLYKRLWRRQRPLLVMTEMRLDDPRRDLSWRAKLMLQRFGYASADLLCVSARGEIDIYSARLGIPAERFRFVPWHTNVLEPRWCKPSGDYFFAAGRTGRDWRTLADAVRGLDVEVTVVCSRLHASATDFPPNVTVLTDVPYQQYRALLEGAFAVVLPLEVHEYSTGQVVILEAMALGKAVVATRVLGSEDYVLDGQDGLLVPPYDAGALRAALAGLYSSPARAERLGRAAVEKVRRDHTLERYACETVRLAEEAASGVCDASAVNPTESPSAISRAFPE